MMQDKTPMMRWKAWTAATAAGVSILAAGGGAAWAQLTAGKGPVDITGDSAEFIDAQHLSIWRGNVQVVQNDSRLVSDVLNVYYTGSAAAVTGGPPAPAQAAAAGQNSAPPQVEKLVADGHVFYASPTQTAKADHLVYEKASDTITMTGDVVVVQGQNVVKGDKLVIDVQTNHANMISNVQGRNHPERVRGVFYNNGTNGPGAPAAPAAKPAASQAASPAKP